MLGVLSYKVPAGPPEGLETQVRLTGNYLCFGSRHQGSVESAWLAMLHEYWIHHCREALTLSMTSQREDDWNEFETLLDSTPCIFSSLGCYLNLSTIISPNLEFNSFQGDF